MQKNKKNKYFRIIFSIVICVFIFTIILPLSYAQNRETKKKKVEKTNELIENKYNLAQEYCKNGEIKKGVEILKEVIKNYPSNQTGYAYYLLGHCFWSQHYYSKSIEYFKRFISSNPDHKKIPLIYDFIAGGYEGLLNTKEARSWYKKLLKEYPSHKLANIAQDQLKGLESYVGMLRKLTNSYLNSAKEAYNNKEYKLSIKRAQLIHSFVAVDSTGGIKAQYLIGQNYEKLDKVERAVLEYKKVLEFGPQSKLAKKANERIKALQNKSKK